VFEEFASGASRARPQLAAALTRVRRGDTLVVARIDRLARSLSHLLAVVEGLRAKGAHFRSLADPIDTSGPSGVLVLQMLGAVAEFERTLIISRTSDGRLAAKARGVAFGRPKKMRPDQQELARELVRDGKLISAVARTFNVHPATIHRVLVRRGRRPYAGFLFLSAAQAYRASEIAVNSPQDREKSCPGS
jgi:DNA invertase Pin-like site-specific DNA recombinase